MQIRRLEPIETNLHRDLRLWALRDAPNSYGETLADAEARPISYWVELTRSVTEPNHQVMFIAYECEHALGSVYGLLDRQRNELGRVGGMWVEPAWRRQGVGRSLLRAVFGWAHHLGLNRLGLWAPDHSPAAIAIYYQAGFRETGRRRPLPMNPSLEIVEMESQVLQSGDLTI